MNYECFAETGDELRIGAEVRIDGRGSTSERQRKYERTDDELRIGAELRTNRELFTSVCLANK